MQISKDDLSKLKDVLSSGKQKAVQREIDEGEKKPFDLKLYIHIQGLDIHKVDKDTLLYQYYVQAPPEVNTTEAFVTWKDIDP